MTRITVEIPKEQDLNTLLALLRQMNLRVVERRPVAQKSQNTVLFDTASVKAELLAKPTRESFDKEVIKGTQNWKGQHDKAIMMQIIKDMDIQEPIEQLLAQLSRCPMSLTPISSCIISVGPM